MSMTPSNPASDRNEPLREALAALEHDQWVEWSRTVAEQGLTPERMARWERYWVPYEQLDESTKDHDRVWADKVLAALATERAIGAALDVDALSNALRIVYGGLTPPIAFGRLAEEIATEYARLTPRKQYHDSEAAETARLRALLWQHHNHTGQYGDDGEMQCSAGYPADFLRDSIEVIERHLNPWIASETPRPGERSDHVHDPVYAPNFANAVCWDCGYFPLPLGGARFVPKLLAPNERAAGPTP